MGLFKKMKEKKVTNMLMDRLFMSIKLKGWRRGEPRINHKKEVKKWLDTKVHGNGRPVMIQYLPSKIVETENMPDKLRKAMNVSRNREGFVTSVSQTLAKLLIMNGEAKLVS